MWIFVSCVGVINSFCSFHVVVVFQVFVSMNGHCVVDNVFLFLVNRDVLLDGLHGLPVLSRGLNFLCRRVFWNDRRLVGWVFYRRRWFCGEPVNVLVFTVRGVLCEAGICRCRHL